MSIVLIHGRARKSEGNSHDVRVGGSIWIGDIKITVEKKAGQLARLRIVADEEIIIRRFPPEMAATTA